MAHFVKPVAIPIRWLWSQTQIMKKIVPFVALVPGLLIFSGAGCAGADPVPAPAPAAATGPIVVNTTSEPIAKGKFAPTWESLQQYQVPDWYRNAKFGIWAHWGPQCAPEDGDWYARYMYDQGSRQYNQHIAQYGHPSEFGFKDVIHTWKAEKWDPDKLVALYKRVGAQYFFALANHHDNFDLWDSKYQPWNSVKVGPQKDLIGGWAKAARKQGLPFGVSVHAAHAWSWYELAQGADRTGPKAGVPYDGKLTKADGAGKWWDGLDPQDLYAQNHTPSPGFQNAGAIHGRWNWNNGVSQPDQAYNDKFYNRTVDLINKYNPDLIYFDDTALPMWPESDAGLKIAAHFYNHNMQTHNGKLEGVIFGKILTDDQRKALLWDIERGVPGTTLPYAWQTDTCIGDWHYERATYNRNGYKSAGTVVKMLTDIVSKNGNLLLNIPVRGDGSIDEKEEAILQGIAAWMDVNKEAIFDTRPWTIFGEGPASAGAALSAQGFNEGRGKPFTAQDIRYTTKGKELYALTLGLPSKQVVLQALATGSPLVTGQPTAIKLLGYNGQLQWTRTPEALVIQLPAELPSKESISFKISGLNTVTNVTPEDLSSLKQRISTAPDEIVQAGADGSFLLAPDAAHLEGTDIRVENGGENIGYWLTPANSAAWTMNVTAPGTYRVTMEAAVANTGTDYVVEVGTQQLKARTADTGGWGNYKSTDLGTIEVKGAGKTTLKVRPASQDADKWQAFNIRSVKLTKVAP